RALRMLIGRVTLVLISFVVYGLIRAMPGDPTTLRLLGDAETGNITVSDERYQEMRNAYGLDQPWWLAYLSWLGDVLRGDLGLSLHQNVPVRDIILAAAGPTLLLSIGSLLLGYALSIPLGLYGAHRPGKLDERLLSAALYMLYSFPSYVVAVFLLLVFGV